MHDQPPPVGDFVMFVKHFLAPMFAAIPGMLSRILAARIVDKREVTIREVVYRMSTVAVFGLMGGGLALWLNLHYLIGCTMAALFGNCGGTCLKIWPVLLEKWVGVGSKGK